MEARQEQVAALLREALDLLLRGPHGTGELEMVADAADHIGAALAALGIENEQDDGPSDSEMWEQWDAEDAAKEPGDSFDPYAGGVVFERDASDW